MFSKKHYNYLGVGTSLGATSDLIKQFYSRHTAGGSPGTVPGVGYSPHHHLDSPEASVPHPHHHHPYLNYTSRLNTYTNSQAAVQAAQAAATAAALKPYSMSATASMMTAAMTAASPPGAGLDPGAWHPDAAANLYATHPAASFHLNQQRGQTWYTGN